VDVNWQQTDKISRKHT